MLLCCLSPNSFSVLCLKVGVELCTHKRKISATYVGTKEVHYEYLLSLRGVIVVTLFLFCVRHDKDLVRLEESIQNGKGTYISLIN